MAGTTQPGWSEGLRAQVAMVQPAGSHAVADYQSVGGIVEGRSKRGGQRFAGVALSVLHAPRVANGSHQT